MTDHNLEYALRSFFFSILLLLIGQTPLINSIRNAYLYIANPMQLGLFSVGTRFKEEARFISNIKKLQALNYEYEKENIKLTLQLSEFKEVKQENSVLKEQLNLKLEEGKTLIEAQVLGRDTVGGSAVVLVNKGSKSGIAVGQVAVLGRSLIGFIEQVTVLNSKVRLITDAKSNVAVLDQDSPDRARGLVKGQYATTLVMEKIYQDETISVDDTIVTSGEDEKYPKGLIVGKVREVFEEEDRVLKSAEVEPVIDFTKLEWVFILK